MLLGQRDTLTLMLNRGSMSQLQSTPLVQDDLANMGAVKSRGWGAIYSHRLTPLSAFTVGVKVCTLPTEPPAGFHW